MELKGFVFGIRVSQSFHIADKLGAIIDKLLYTKESSFGPSLFPTVQESNGSKVLLNTDTGDKLTVTHSDFIFDYSVKKDFDEEFNKFLEAYNDIIIKKIFKVFDIHNIARFGFILKAELAVNDKITKSVHDIISNSNNGYTPDSYSLRYNIKEKKPIKIKDVITEDFDNIIVTYDKANEDSPLIFSVDYQKYFKPALISIGDSTTSFESFCKNSYSKYKKLYCKE